MNSGIVAMRYAKALLRYTEERGRTECVLAQVRELLRSVRDGMELEAELAQFCELVIRRGRRAQLKSILLAYADLCLREKGLKLVKLTSAVEMEELAEKVKNLLQKQFGENLLLETRVDERLIGGFVVEVDGQRLDASVRHQLELLRRQFVRNNNRLV